MQKAPGGGSRLLPKSLEPGSEASLVGGFTLLRLHTDFAVPFLVKLFLTDTLKVSGAEV